jgi:hypothetical protein
MLVSKGANYFGEWPSHGRRLRVRMLDRSLAKTDEYDRNESLLDQITLPLKKDSSFFLLYEIFYLVYLMKK